MTKLYCIVSDITYLSNPDTYRLLKDAAERKGVEFVTIDANTTAPSTVNVEDGSLLYRLGLSSLSVFMEAYLYKPSLATFYKEYPTLLSRAFDWGSTIRFQKAGLPIIPTVFKPFLLNSDELSAAVEQLGGFPVIVKGSGGSHGSAVRKADSQGELEAMLRDDEVKNTLVLRKFVHSARHIRVVIVGGVAYDAIEYDVQPDDFRTNAVEVPTVQPFSLQNSPEIARTAEAAVAAIDLEFGGVDILIQPDGTHYIAEANFPCNFARNQMNTGADVAGAMIDALLAKRG